MALLDGLSQADKLMADTLVQKAEGQQFDVLARMYGLPRIAAIPIRYWRKALIAANFAKRDSRVVIYSFLREALRFWDTAYTIKVDPQAPKHTRIYWVAGGAGAGFVAQDVFRLWEIGGKVYWSIQGDGVWAGGLSPYLELSPFANPSWKGCNWGVGEDPVLPPGAFTNKAAIKLPFVYRAYNAIVEIFMDIGSTVPPTYMQQFFTWKVPTQDGPNGTTVLGVNVLDSFKMTDAGTLERLSLSEVKRVFTSLTAEAAEAATTIAVNDTASFPAAGSFSSGTRTWNYTGKTSTTFTGCTIAAGSTGLVLAKGAVVFAELTPARGGSVVATLFKNGVATAMTCTLAAADKTAADAVNTVAYVAGDVIRVELDVAAGVTQQLVQPAVSVFRQRVGGEPLGGHLMPNAIADNPANGPWPIYLTGGPAKDWEAILSNMVAAGVVVRAKVTTAVGGA